MHDNDFRGNARFDCVDLTAPSIDNTRSDNQGDDSDPDDICGESIPGFVAQQ